jgi:hypothetical protein
MGDRRRKIDRSKFQEAEIVSAMTVNQHRAKRFTALDKHQPDMRVATIQPDPLSHSLRSESRLALHAVDHP